MTFQKGHKSYEGTIETRFKKGRKIDIYNYYKEKNFNTLESAIKYLKIHNEL